MSAGVVFFTFFAIRVHAATHFAKDVSPDDLALS